MKSPLDAVITSTALATAYGPALTDCMTGLYEGRDAFGPIRRFSACSMAAEAGYLSPFHGTVLEPMLECVESAAKQLPEEAPLFFATTVGAADLIEHAESDTADFIFRTALRRFQKQSGTIVSGACASSNLALMLAMRQIHAGKMDCAVIAACDAVTEFTWSGFSAMGAVSPGKARPFDANRDGLLLGDAAGVICLTSRQYAERHELPVLAVLEDSAASCDASHITAPCSKGTGLIRAIRKLDYRRADAVLAHGTGTVYNDAMEINAVNALFPADLPMVSVKGGCGHTLGAAGIVQTCAAVEVLRRQQLFPQTGLQTPAPGAEQRLSSAVRSLNAGHLLVINAGFGGVNAVLLIGKDGAV